MKTKISSFFYLAGIFGFIASLFFTMGCRRAADNSANLLKADTLQHMVNVIDETLILDEDHFKQRMDSMNVKLKVIHAKYRDTTDDETKSAIVRYEGIEKNYEEFLRTYPLMQFDCDKHKKTIEGFKQDIISQKIPQTEINRFYEDEKPKLVGLLEHARTVTRNTYSIEGDYNRSNPIITKLYEREKNM